MLHYIPFWIYLGILLLCLSIFIPSAWKDRNLPATNNNEPLGMWGIFLGGPLFFGVISLLPTFIISMLTFAAMDNPEREEFSVKFELVALLNKDQVESSSSWAFFVGIGGGSSRTITDSYYYYFVRYRDGIQMEKVPMLDKSVFLNELETKSATVEEVWARNKHSKFIVKHFARAEFDGEEKVRTILNIPDGSIKKEFKVEL